MNYRAACILGIPLLVGCITNPDQIIERQGWTSNLKVPESLVPGDLIYMGQKGLQKLPGNVPGFTPEVRDSQIEDQQHNTSWRFSTAAGLVGPGDIGSLKGALDAQNVSSVTVTFTDVTNSSLGGNSWDSLPEAKKRAEWFVANVPTTTRSELGRQVGNGEVWLVTQTLNAKVNYQFTSATGVSAAVSLPGANAQFFVKDEQKGTLVFAKPLSIAYRALPLAVRKTSGFADSTEPDYELALKKATGYGHPK